jgi:hypothetical protein
MGLFILQNERISNASAVNREEAFDDTHLEVHCN